MELLIYNLFFIGVVLYLIKQYLNFNITAIRFIRNKSFTNDFFIIVGLIIGYLFTYKINYVKNVKSTKTRLQELVLFANNNCYHIHHYMWMMLVIFTVIIERKIKTKKYINGILAFLIGSSLVDLLYKDWMLIKDNCHNDKIMKFFKHHKDNK